jgi:acylphosphatase
MTKEACLHFLVKGKVQGVFYRDSTRRKAKELGVVGWIRNVNDGNVEGVVCGELDKVNELCKWLWSGPPSAAVSDVQVEEISFELHEDFEILE